jgi:hypothetical protein
MRPIRVPSDKRSLPVQAFYALTASYLTIGLVVACRSPARAAQPGWRAQLAVLRAVLGVGLLWPERLRAALDPFGSR